MPSLKNRNTFIFVCVLLIALSFIALQFFPVFTAQLANENFQEGGPTGVIAGPGAASKSVPLIAQKAPAPPPPPPSCPAERKCNVSNGCCPDGMKCATSGNDKGKKCIAK